MSFKNKAFDCVEFKNRVQAELSAEYAGMTDDEIRARMHEKLATSDHPIAEWWRELTDAKKTSGSKVI